jgi:hypothetical protein
VHLRRHDKPIVVASMRVVFSGARPRLGRVVYRVCRGARRGTAIGILCST